MSEYKRLTCQKWTDDIDLTKEYGYSYIYKRLYELEDKIENGTLREVPCKVGDMIYVPWVWKGADGIMTLTVSEIGIFEQFIQIVCSDLETDDFEFERQFNFGMFYDYDFGKIWFIDIKAAEARLKELQEGKK